MKRIREYIFILSFLTIFILVFTYPAIFSLTDKLLGDGGDNLQFFGWIQIALNNLHEGKSLFSYSNVWRYPHGFDFSRNIDSHLFILLGVFLTQILENKVLAYNIGVFVLFIINGLSAYLFFRFITRSSRIAFLGSIIYGFSFHSLAKNGSHPNLLFTGGFPLFAYFLLKIREESKPKKYIFGLGFSTLLIALGSLQYFLMFLVSVIVLFLLALIFYKNWLINFLKILYKNFVFFILCFLMFSSFLLIFTYPYIEALITKTFIQRTASFEELAYWSPRLLDYLRPHAYFKLWYSNFFKPGEKFAIDFSVFLGFIELGLFLLFLLSKIKTRLKFFIFTSFFVFFLFSLGPKNPDTGLFLPYGFLIRFFPFWGIQEAGRWYVIFYFFFVLGIILFLRTTTYRLFFKQLYFIILILLIIERITPSFYLTPINFDRQGYVKAVKETVGSAVIDLPIDLTASPIGTYYDAIPAFYQKKIVNGYLHWSVDSLAARSWINESTAYRFMCDNYHNKKYLTGKKFNLLRPEENNVLLIDLMRKYDIRTIILHKDEPFHLYFTECSNVLAEVTYLLPRFIVIKETKEKTMLENRRYYANYLHYKLFFPKGGLFTLHNLHYSLAEEGPAVKLMLNEAEIDTSEWANTSSFDWGRWTRWTTPHLPQEIYVLAGSTLIFSNEEYIEKEGFLNIWYEFYEDSQSIYIKPPVLENGLQKIYDDEKKEVWQLN